MESLQSSFSCEKVCTEVAVRELPDHRWTRHLLDAVRVGSFLPGRIRFSIGFPGSETLGDTLRRELQKEPSVRLASYSERTHTALVTFDPAQVESLAVMKALVRGVLEYARLHGECRLGDHHHHDSPFSSSCDREGNGEEHDDCEHDHSRLATDAGIRKELLKLVLTGGVLGYFLLRKLRNRPILFPNNPFLDIAGLVTIASGYPIFRSGVKSVQKRRKATDDTLISIAVIATLLMGESLTGLSVVWLINLGRLLEAITLKRSRTAIKELMDITPPEAWREEGTSLRRVPVEKILKGQRIRVFAVDRKLAGTFVVEDRIRPEARAVLARLKGMGIRKLMIATGDREKVAAAVASALGGVELHAELLPEDKLALITRLKAEGYRVAMVGDGVNDAQALAKADLSIALGAGRCDVAMESADVTLARDDLFLVPECLEISDKTLRTIYQNFIASVGINVAGIGLSMFGRLTPFSAAIVHNASTIAVVLNSLRLGREVAGGNPLAVIKEVRI